MNKAIKAVEKITKEDVKQLSDETIRLFYNEYMGRLKKGLRKRRKELKNHDNN